MENAAESPPRDDVDSKFIENLPTAQFFDYIQLCEWKGSRLSSRTVKGAVAFERRFEARDDDVLLASAMKTGTTWLKALTFCITARGDDSLAVERENPHFLVPTVEAVTVITRPPPFNVYDGASGARLIHTHLPHALLPESAKGSDCKIVYVARNPKDTLISSWHYYNSFARKDGQRPFPLEEYVDGFCSGIHPFGPLVEHVAGYWEESKKRPEKILFLKYEELKQDPKREVMKIAEFLGKAFEDEGDADEIVRRCSMERLKNSEVNKSGSIFPAIPNSSFFRKGEVGDSNNYLTLEMETKIHQTIGLKLEALGLYL